MTPLSDPAITPDYIIAFGLAANRVYLHPYSHVISTKVSDSERSGEIPQTKLSLQIKRLRSRRFLRAPACGGLGRNDKEKTNCGLVEMTR